MIHHEPAFHFKWLGPFIPCLKQIGLSVNIENIILFGKNRAYQQKGQVVSTYILIHQSLVKTELLACQSCFLVPTMGYHSVSACSTCREVHFLRWTGYLDQGENQLNNAWVIKICMPCP